MPIAFDHNYASYKTSSGVVSGIQWVPAEATQILPSGAQPANAVSVKSHLYIADTYCPD
jgi:hypothetical protein